MDNKDVDTLGIPAFKKKKVKRMKVMKGQGLLYIFNILKEKGRVKKEEIINALEITDLSFWRYIQEIKAFIYNFNLPYELIYDRKNEVYVLEINEQHLEFINAYCKESNVKNNNKQIAKNDAYLYNVKNVDVCVILF